ncbi:uncharacterized protein CEXT_143491 [Caerostris extrusa]|uniref:Uncharacterized protein n=1 Tax=Caerostris extrusa TaxID=172846 RepID=A0AAV4V4Y8_CAEEX|nr:uncharacterized protein CEXT_143491 [Caerostris extrusa]
MVRLCYFCFFLCYSTVLLSILTIPSEISPVSNFKELSNAVLRNNYKCFVPKGSNTLDYLLKNNVKHLRLLGEKIVQHQWYFKDYPLTLSPEIDTDSALVNSKTLLHMVSGPEGWKHHFLSEDVLMPTKFGVPMTKGFCHKSKINTIVSRLNNAGLYKKFVNDETFKLWLVSPDKRRIVTFKGHSLSCRDLMGAFISLFIGLGLSFLVFLGEISFVKFRKVFGCRSSVEI